MSQSDSMDFANISSLADRTVQWMKDIGAVWISRTEVCGEISKHITVREWAEHFDQPTNDDGVPTAWTYKLWGNLKMYMIAQGIPIARHPAIGHYLGESGNQVSNVILNVKTALALLQTSMAQLEMIRESGKAVDCLEKMKGRMLPDRLVNLLEQTTGVVPERYNGVPSDSLVLLLESGPEND